MHPRRFTAAAAAVALTAALTACAPGGERALAEGAVSATLLTDPSSFDPATARAADDYIVARLLYDTLLRRDADNALTGGIAEQWRAIDAATYAFTIRDDASCADGTPITATVVADSLARFLDPETASSARVLVTGGATAEVTADDAAASVTVALSEPWSDFLTGMALPQSGIVCPAGLADIEGTIAGEVFGAFSGPYTLASARAAISYELALRPDYTNWPEFATPLMGEAPRTLRLVPMAEDATIATQLLAGELQLGTISQDSVPRIEAAGDFALTTVANVTTYLAFNERPGTVFADDPELRAAVAQALDPVAYNDILNRGGGTVLDSVGSPNLSCVVGPGTIGIEFDPAAAAAVLNGVPITIVGTTGLGAGNEYVAEALRNAGADVTLQSLDNATWSTVTGAGGSDWDVTVQGDINVIGTLPSSLLRVMGPVTEDGGRSKTGADNPAGEAALAEAMATTDEAAKCAALEEAQVSLLERVDAFPLATQPTTVATAEGVEVRAFGDYIDYATIRITDGGLR